jgi:crossover junction endodeoxyribonuclease RuvC
MSAKAIRILGIDPGLRRTGWGVIVSEGNSLKFAGCGTITSNSSADLATRLCELHTGILGVIREFDPDEAAVENTFVNRNGAATLKLGQARGIALLAPASSGLRVAEYAPNLVKKSVVGTGHADKGQIHKMISILLPGAQVSGDDAADALAIAITHAHHRVAHDLSRMVAS